MTNSRLLLFLLNCYLQCLRCFQPNIYSIAASLPAGAVSPHGSCSPGVRESRVLGHRGPRAPTELPASALLTPGGETVSRKHPSPHLWPLRMTPTASCSIVRTWTWTRFGHHTHPSLGQAQPPAQAAPHSATSLRGCGSHTTDLMGTDRTRSSPALLSSTSLDLRTLVAAWS